MTKAVPASPTLAYLIPGGAFASGQGYYVDRSPRGLLRQLVHRGALCRTGVSWLQPPHPTPIPKRRLGRRGALVDKQCCLAGRPSAKLSGDIQPIDARPKRIPFVRLAATCPENGFTGLWTEGAIPGSPFGRSSLISCASSAAPTRSEPSPQCNRSQYLLDAGVPSRGRSVSCQLGPAPCVREEDWWTLSGSG